MLSIGRHPYFYRENAQDRDFLPTMQMVRILTKKNAVTLYHKVAQICDTLDVYPPPLAYNSIVVYFILLGQDCDGESTLMGRCRVGQVT
jgi:hypothetical protein